MFEIEMLRNKRKKWYFRIKSSNGQILCHSESYSSRTAARRTAAKLKANLKHSGKKIIETKEIA